VVGIVAVCAAAAVVAIVGGTVLLSRNESTASGTPVLQLEVSPDTPLAKAANLLNNGHAAAAAAIFKRSTTPEAKLGLAFAEWRGPSSLAGVKAIVAANPDDPALLLNLGWANYAAGSSADASSAWQQTASRFPDSPYAVDALNALNPGVAPGLPPIVVDFTAVSGKARADLEAGWRAWRTKHVVTARQKLDAAARLAPNVPETLVAAAVARFSPANPTAPFPLLGPLSGRFPHAAIVRLHLGEVLLWRREIAKGKEQLRLAVSAQPGSPYAKQAKLILQALR
jgi:tetratricopeptide (TPR) repeat protein